MHLGKSVLGPEAPRDCCDLPRTCVRMYMTTAEAPAEQLSVRLTPVSPLHPRHNALSGSGDQRRGLECQGWESGCGSPCAYICESMPKGLWTEIHQFLCRLPSSASQILWRALSQMVSSISPVHVHTHRAAIVHYDLGGQMMIDFSFIYCSEDHEVTPRAPDYGHVGHSIQNHINGAFHIRQ
mmetsp:Transcript_100671/g.170175  ORF Transcript_100671/g.170175 Transcript_100671/m.170175 type:complete len:182 (-) Transcript_100671:790-1335(-)